MVASLEGRLPRDVVLAVARTPLDLTDHWSGHDFAIVIDAVRGVDPPGTVSVVQVGKSPIAPTTGPGGTHGLGVAEVVELARATGSLPAQVTLVGVAAEQFALGAPMSPAVAASVEHAAATVLDLLATMR